MKNVFHPINVHKRGAVTLPLKNRRQFACASLVGSLRYPDEKMAPGLADIATVQRSRSRYLMNHAEKSSERLAYALDLASPASCSWTRHNREICRRHGHVFDKRRVRMRKVGFK